MVCRLKGIIAYRPGHYNALCKRITNHWEVYDGLKDNVSAWKKNCLLVPHGAIYIKIND